MDPIKPVDGEQYSRSSSVLTTVLAPNEERGFSAYGQRFYFINATAPLEAKTDLSAYKPYRKGTGENFTDEFRFKRVQFHNPNTYSIFIQVFVGFGDYLDTTSELVESFTQGTGTSTVTIPATTSITLNGNPSGIQLQRKSLIVSNLDPTNNIYVRDANDNYTAAVFPKTTISLPISGPVKVYNGTGAPIPVCIGEIWYTYLPS